MNLIEITKGYEPEQNEMSKMNLPETVPAVV